MCSASAVRIPAGELDAALEGGGLSPETADKMIENAIGTLALPFGVALNVRVNGADYLVPMAIEEPSVVAAASHAAKRVRAGGGFTGVAAEPLMVAQIEVHDVADPAGAVARIGVARAGSWRWRRARCRGSSSAAAGRGRSPRVTWARALWWRRCWCTSATRWARTR